MQIKVQRWSDTRPDLALIWNDMRRENPALSSPYFHPRFTGIVDSASPPWPVEVALIYDNGELSAFLPFHRLPNNVGVPVGHFLNDYQGLICRPSFRGDLKEIVAACRLSVFDFDHAIKSQRCFTPFTTVVAPSPQIDLSIGDYRNSQSVLKAEQIKIRRIERDLGPLRFIAHSTDPMNWLQFCSWKSDQYRRSNVDNIFLIPWVQQVLEQARHADGKDFSGMFSLLFAGPHFVAAQFGMRSGSLFHWWFPAYDPIYSKYSPGIQLLLKFVEAAPMLGISKIDFGKGDSKLKQRFMNCSEDVASGSVELISIPSLRRQARRFAARVARRAGLRAA